MFLILVNLNLVISVNIIGVKIKVVKIESCFVMINVINMSIMRKFKIVNMFIFF